MPIRLNELHPILVHFPIALLITAVALDFLAVIARRPSLADVALWCLLLGTIGADAAFLSGDVIEHGVEHGPFGGILRVHKLFAVATVLTFGGLLAVRLMRVAPRLLGALGETLPALRGVGQRLRVDFPVLYASRVAPALMVLYFMVSLAGLVFLTLTGYYGGSLVYDHAVGVPAAAPAVVPTP